MPTNQDGNMSVKLTQGRENRYDFFKLFRLFFTLLSRYLPFGARFSISDVENRQTTTATGQDYPAEKEFDIIKYFNENKEQLKEKYGFYPQQTKHRVSRYYHVNKNRTILIILQGDITKIEVDAVVNAANEHMMGGSGVDGMIHRAAGHELRKACGDHKEITRGVRLPTGHSRILLSYNMSKTTYYIINTAGPVYNSRMASKCAEKLSSCYKTALALADLYDLESIGFTAISCGIFGYPANDGAEVALRTVDENAKSVPVVVFVLWDDHIYDAWIKKADELKLTKFDPMSPIIQLPSNNDNGKETVENSDTAEDKEKSPATLNPSVRDPSTPNIIETTSEGEVEELLKKLPSVPNDASDTQQTEDMDQNENSVEIDQNLHPQKTMEMTDVNSEEQKTEADDNTKDDIHKSDNEKITPNDDDDDSKQQTGQEGTENDDVGKTTIKTVHTEHSVDHK